jgi:hypothetical protein
MVEGAGGRKTAKKGGPFLSKAARARKIFLARSGISETQLNLRQRRIERAAIDKIPLDHIDWGKKKDGSGVWYKKRNGKGHIKAYTILY